MSPNAWCFVLVSGMLVLACARGTEETDGFVELSDSDGYGGYGASGTTSSTSSTPGFGGTNASGGAGGGLSSGGTSAGGSTAQGGSGGFGGQGGQGGSCDFTAPNSCATAQVLSSIRGDEGSDFRVDYGVGSKWLQIYVEEAVSSIFTFPALSFTATLTSPPGMNYDLYIYRGDENNTDCYATPTKGTGSPETVYDVWGDTIGVEDGTWFAIEVRYVSGDDCSPSTQWTFTIEGNT